MDYLYSLYEALVRIHVPNDNRHHGGPAEHDPREGLGHEDSTTGSLTAVLASRSRVIERGKQNPDRPLERPRGRAAAGRLLARRGWYL